MKINNWFLRSAAAASIVAITLVSSCKEEERFNAQDAQALSEEAIADAYYEDSDDMSSSVVYETQNPTNGRVTGDIISEDDRLKTCATVSFADGSTNVSGTITIDFGTGCTVKGNTREGKIILTYSNGPAGTSGFTVVTTFESYKINGVELKGTRTVVRQANSIQNAIEHHITLVDGQAIWPDGSKIERSSDFTRVWIRDQEDPRVQLDGSASGVTRAGKSYTMEITQTLIYRRECIVADGIFMAVQGSKVFNTDSKQISINYGNGDCDRSVTISVNGVSREVAVGNK